MKLEPQYFEGIDQLNLMFGIRIETVVEGFLFLILYNEPLFEIVFIFVTRRS